MDKRIDLILIEGVWHARWSGPEAPRLYKIFGTATIPTPFKAPVDRTVILAAIEKRNPDYVVAFA